MLKSVFERMAKEYLEKINPKYYSTILKILSAFSRR